MWLRSSAVPMSGLSTRASNAETTSFRLCGGMLVAMPTAMPCVDENGAHIFDDIVQEGSSANLSKGLAR